MTATIFLTDGYEGEDAAVVTKACPLCQVLATYALDPDKALRWAAGTYAQTVWPEQSADWREQLISGCCPNCFDAHFSDSPDEGDDDDD